MGVLESSGKVLGFLSVKEWEPDISASMQLLDVQKSIVICGLYQ